MPPRTKEFLYLTQGIQNPRILNHEYIYKRMKVFETLLKQFSNTRHYDRKKRYEEQLRLAFQNLCILAKRNLLFKDEIKDLEKDCSQHVKHTEELIETISKLERKLDSSKDYKALYEEQKRINRQHEGKHGNHQRELEALEKKLATAKARIKRLTEK